MVSCTCGTEAGGVLCRESHLHAFHGLNGNDGLRQAAVQARVPGGVRSQAGGHAVRDHFEDAAHGVAGAIGLVHHFLHALFGFGIHAAQQDFGFARSAATSSHAALRSRRTPPTAITWLAMSMPNWISSALATRADGHARGGFAGAGALQNVAGIVRNCT